MNELDGVAAELADARDELREVLLWAGEWARWRASEDPVAALIADRLNSAFSRVTMANIAGTTAMQEGSRG